MTLHPSKEQIAADRLEYGPLEQYLKMNDGQRCERKTGPTVAERYYDRIPTVSRRRLHGRGLSSHLAEYDGLAGLLDLLDDIEVYT